MENIKRLIPYLKPHRKAISISVVCMIASGILSATFLYLFETVLKQILALGLPDRMTRVNYFMAIVFVWAILRVVTDFAMTYFTQRTGQRALTHLRSDLFQHLQNLSVGYFERQRTGEVMSRLTNDLFALQTVMTVAVITTIRAPVEILGALGYMLFRNWRLSLFIVFLLPPVAWLINRAGHRIRSATSLLQSQLAQLTNYLQEKISAMRLIQTFGTRDYEIGLFNNVNQMTYQRTMTPIRIQASLAPTIDFISYIGVLAVLWVGAYTRMEPEKLLVFIFAMHRAAMNFKAIASLNAMFKSAEAASERLFDIIDTKPDVTDAPDAIDLAERKVNGRLSFENVRFSYNGKDDVLHGISFSIEPGEVVALAGLSGSGKTTISNLVPRLYDPAGGRVILDGVDLRDIKLQSLRSKIGAVPQETTLFHGTIRDNIAYGSPNATLDEVVEAARRANADDFIRAQPQGYDTPIGERGARLSGGQRQRVAIARALLRDPRILILDEATSSLDAESESLVQEALGRLMEGRTTLIIAHRFSTIRHANKILVMSAGNIAETGTHDELLKRNGIYSRLYQMQTFAARAEEKDEQLEEGQPIAGQLPAARLAI